jgi:hypothetical protein
MSGKTPWTPAPWAWAPDLHPYSDQWTLSPGVLIADGRNGTPGGDEADQANARLIACAPEMAEMLWQYRNDLRHPPAPDSIERRLEAINALLSRIEGEK